MLYFVKGVVQCSSSNFTHRYHTSIFFLFLLFILFLILAFRKIEPLFILLLLFFFYSLVCRTSCKPLFFFYSLFFLPIFISLPIMVEIHRKDQFFSKREFVTWACRHFFFILLLVPFFTFYAHASYYTTMMSPERSARSIDLGTLVR